MTNDEILAAAIRLIKAGKKEAARSILEPFLLENPSYIQAWMWKAELFPNDQDKIKVLESCLQKNPGNPQVTQALNFLKNRAGKPNNNTPSSPFTTEKPASSPSPFTTFPSVSPFSEQPAQKPLPPFSESPFAQPSTSSPFLSESAAPIPVKPKIEVAPSSSPQFETTETNQIPIPQKKPKRKRSKTTDVLIVVGACLAFALLAGIYIGGGFYLNQKIDRAFSQQQCSIVVQYKYFASLYPQGIFSSAFTSYDQYTQCRFKLDVDQAVELKNWGTAVTLAQDYLSAYPNDVFAAEMNQQVVSILSQWSQQLLADKNYNDGIDKLEQLVAAYPTGPTAAPAQDEILQTYIVWAKELTDKQNYSEAEQNLKTALTYFETDSARALKVKEELANVYISWGDMQVGIGNVDNAIKYYQQAGELSQGATDVNLLIAKAYLQQAMMIADKSDFNRALSKVQEIADSAQADNIKAEANAARDNILKKYSDSTSQQAVEQMTNGMASICRGQRPELPIFGLDQKNIRFGLVTIIPMQLPTELAAQTPGQLHYVACAVEKEKEIQTCAYVGHSLIRLRYEWETTLYNMVTGQAYAANTFQGSDPADCKAKEPFPSGVKDRKSYGGKPSLSDIAAWLKSLNITQ